MSSAAAGEHPPGYDYAADDQLYGYGTDAPEWGDGFDYVDGSSQGFTFDDGGDSSRSSFTMETLPQFDGSVWRRYDFPESTFLLTSEGRQLLNARRIGNLLREYADEARDGRTVDRDVRKFLVEAGNSRVFTVGDTEMVVKERKMSGEPLEPALERMDALLHVVQTRCPRWIDIPKHYGIFTYKPTGQEFMLLEKIDGGVTAGDILGYGEQQPREDHLEEEVERNFGEVTPELKKEVRDQFDEMVDILNTQVKAAGLDPEELLPDLEGTTFKIENLHNVLVNPEPTPVAGKNLKFWLIDQ